MNAPIRFRLTHASLALIVTGLFVGVMLAVVAADARTGGDEAYYTDGALRMLASGDFLTPRTADGSLRMRKPPLAYWLIAGSWQVFGISHFTALLPFVLVMGMVLWLTFLLTQALFRNDAAAVVAVAMLAGNHNVIYAAERTIPDGPLALFVALGLLGFARLLLPDPALSASGSDRARGRARLFAWAGSGLAVASKGLLGLVLAAFGIAYALSRRRDRAADAPALLGPLSAAAGCLIALGWFVMMMVRHGSDSLNVFFADQVTGRFATAALIPVNFGQHLPKYLLTLVSDFLPWSLLVGLIAALNPGAAREFVREHRNACAFAVGWALLLLVIFSSGHVTRPRYLLPAYPALAAFAAALLTALVDGERARRWLTVIGRTAVVTGLGLALLLVLAGIRTDVRIAIAGALLTAATLLLSGLARNRRWPAAPAAVGLWIVLAIASYDGVIRGIFQASPAPQMLSALQAAGVAGDRVMAVGVGTAALNALRVRSGGQVWPTETAGAGPEEALSQGMAAVLLGPEDGAAFAAAGWQLQPAGWSYEPIRGPEIRALLRGANWEDLLARQRRVFNIAFPPAHRP